MHDLPIDQNYLVETLDRMLHMHSPSGRTDDIVRFVGGELEALGIPLELTRRGAIRAELLGRIHEPDRAIVSHVDTLGAMVRLLKDNGRLGIWPIGTWSSRFAEGARVTIFTEQRAYRGTILPLKASGHTFNEEVDSQPVSWDHVEVRVDARELRDAASLRDAGFAVGDFVGIDAQPEFSETGYVNSRHLDNKAGVAAVLAAAKAIREAETELPIDCYLLFTISEEVGSGASAVLHGDVAEMVAIDNSTPAPGQGSVEEAVTVAMMDSTGPFDRALVDKLIRLCRKHSIPFTRDVFRHYRCDAASAVEAGNDIRTALVCFGADASHGWERTHVDSLVGLARLLTLYMQSEPAAWHDRHELSKLSEFD
jgi:peptidase M42 family hydrolase